MEIENTSQDQTQPIETSQNTKKTRSKKSVPPKEEEKEEKPKKEKTPKKEKAPKKEKTPKKEKSETKEPEKKGKRGYKLCKNPACEDYVHIHNKVCPKCGYEFELKNNVKPIPEDPEEFEQMLKKKKTKKEGKAGQEAAEIVAEEETPGIPDMRIIKKGFYRNAYTVNYAKLIKNMQSLKERIFPEYNLAAEVSYKDMEFPKMNTFQISLHAKENNVTSFELPFSKTQEVDFDVKKPWKEVLINAGYPINSVAWAYRGKNNAEENINRDQYFAVSHSSANINKIKTDENTYITLQALNIQNFHKFGTKYDNEEYIAFYQIKWNEQTASYDLPKLMFYMEHKGGSWMEMKWLPISSSSTKEIGILAILTANGTVSIFSIPCVESPQPLEQAVKLNPLEEISLPNVYFTQLAWCPQAPCDKLLIGDIVGNIYLFHVSIQNSK